MPRQVEARPVLTITNANKPWVVQELGKLQDEWSAWLETVKTLPISPDYNPQTCAESIMDGHDIRARHAILREKTLTFVSNNFSGFEFLFESWPRDPHETNQVRLAKVVPNWIHRLAVLSACIQYAQVPDGYWKARGKQLVEKLADTAPEKLIDVAASYLKNPLDA